MEIRFLRHATFVVEVGGLKILVDPMLSPAEAMEPIANAGNQLRIPMVGLPLSEAEMGQVLESLDAVLVTHTHRDHWDAQAQALLPRHLPILCQPEDKGTIASAGFSEVLPVDQHMEWRGLLISRTGGQ
ncbi:MAG: MBL fold metallo-hydrolase, partial [Ktedonobacteraceae bacterium]|nr:MBL fold metallo-hydrolase [Ktedonobacteraceae bacterium]